MLDTYRAHPLRRSAPGIRPFRSKHSCISTMAADEPCSRTNTCPILSTPRGPFYLDRECPEIATLYLQSASGGLYRGDDVALSIVAGPHAAAHVTTQASTLVHRTHRSRRRANHTNRGRRAFFCRDDT